MSNAFAALIWWVVPAAGLIGALGYVLWVTKFQGKFQQETQRSVGQFQRFQDSLRDSQARDVAEDRVSFRFLIGCLLPSPSLMQSAMSGHGTDRSPGRMWRPPVRSPTSLGRLASLPTPLPRCPPHTSM